MSRCCCEHDAGAGLPDVPTRSRAAARHCTGIARWMGPGIILALMPKCPMCLAGYIALWTGIGLSTPAAARLRTTLIVLCTVSLLILAARHAQRLARSFRGSRARPI